MWGRSDLILKGSFDFLAHFITDRWHEVKAIHFQKGKLMAYLCELADGWFIFWVVIDNFHVTSPFLFVVLYILIQPV